MPIGKLTRVPGGREGRLDYVLVARGLVESRSRAAALIKQGAVTVNGQVCFKASRAVSNEDELVVDKGDDYVSRGAFKLLGAFDIFIPQGLAKPKGKLCLDIGASTGGFTDVLLRQGAKEVIALDVGHDQLAQRIRTDSRVREFSGVNVRDLQSSDIPFKPNYVVSDVSFISLTYVIPVIARIAQTGSDCILLVKPQFEVGRGNLGHGGIVRQEQRRQDALKRVEECALENDFIIKGHALSPIKGSHGNEEFLLWLSLR